ncbi:tRNA 2-thiouridine(34) synthase MnmA [Pelagibacterium halotolerans]|uniref:tRNA-specific 2-thiouridylase MnmA n=1 Tax=Pelagibacterium halotolerans (strain DSM 22347 / JCM 15775 / CGMCC 1.7692 / B2) TaxID=1082931 RepID=G4R926_PELHB|nr:tRNA 2-thiouridine(34) synthase MnmA [Pelagibacterium halotolerans]AEQ52406.1 tRNA (5-methylaminomethyl-2-thiouridylate)-methyltransferase [Pelagibacterium halotolerans B2]QJR17863.1 tRNA 2-thiouridine(34) synthase MnmA [Pelagibacterium halotolerans]SEA35466.1 tRNA (5-methylaminomethyl-2-thiouridylate)-methyltransferase [Pelagibacterium halotolerans]
MVNSLGFDRPPGETRVVVAMSGGVDSSVVAGLLAREGYEVIGVTLQLYDHGEATFRKGSCCAGQDIHDARRVSATLGIPHYVLDYEERFRKAVIEPFAESYALGETPIPCVSCNQSVKFVDLMEVARDLGADCLATGHYVRSRIVDGKRQLLRPLDGDKDQTYFLFATTAGQLDFLRFPLGNMTKDETRELARDMGLVVAEKSDSQDICFVPKGSYSDVIKKLMPEAEKPGDIVDGHGRVLGQHKGIIHYTVGQRRGLGIASGEPLYVLRLDAKTQQVVVGPKSALSARTVRLRDLNWLGPRPLAEMADGNGLALEAKVRSTRAPQEAVVNIRHGEVYVTLIAGETGIAPGQACVLYSDDGADAQVLGGGFIAEAVPAALVA